MPITPPRVAQINADIAAQGNKGYSVAPSVFGANPSATSPAKEAYTASLSNPLVSAYNAGGNKPLTTKQIGTATGTATKPDYLKSYRDYLSKYAVSLNENPEVTNATTELTNIQNLEEAKSLESRKAYQDILGKSGMLKGGAQEAAAELNKDNSYILANLGVSESGASRKLAALTGTQTAKQNYYKTLLDLSKPVDVGENYIDPTTGEIVGAKSKTGIAGEYEYAKTQGYTGTFEQYQNEDANRKKSTAAPVGTYKSGGLTYTPQDAAEDSQALENSRGEDGYVDPTQYQNLYEAWIQAGGLLKDFKTHYPPADYVNPDNTWLPSFLMPKKTGVVNPYATS